MHFEFFISYKVAKLSVAPRENFDFDTHQLKKMFNFESHREKILILTLNV